MAKNKPPKPVKIDVPTLDECVRLVKKALQRQQAYSESLDITIMMAAGNYYVYLKTLADIQKHARVQYSFKTREGSTGRKPYPDVESIPGLTRSLQLSLKSLGLTLDTLAMVEDDPLEKLSNKVSDMLNG